MNKVIILVLISSLFAGASEIEPRLIMLLAKEGLSDEGMGPELTAEESAYVSKKRKTMSPVEFATAIELSEKESERQLKKQTQKEDSSKQQPARQKEVAKVKPAKKSAPVVVKQQAPTKAKDVVVEQAKAPVALSSATSSQSQQPQALAPQKPQVKLFDPAPVNGQKPQGFGLERDAEQIITIPVSTKDSITINTCILGGVTILLHQSVDSELSDVVLSDQAYFTKTVLPNNRGVFVRQAKDVNPGEFWETSAWLYRKKDDQPYLVSLRAVPCEDTKYTFPKVVYLADKQKLMNESSGKLVTYKGGDTKKVTVMTSEDKIYSMSEGLERKEGFHQIRAYDMVVSSGESWAVIGVEIQSNKGDVVDMDQAKLMALDSLQLNEIDLTYEVLPLVSQLKSKETGKNILRMSVKMRMDKTYITQDRYIHLMYLNKKTKHFQYTRIDLMALFNDLKKRGVEL